MVPVSRICERIKDVLTTAVEVSNELTRNDPCHVRQRVLGSLQQIGITDIRDLFAVLQTGPVNAKRMGKATAKELLELLSRANGGCSISVWTRIV